MSEDCLNVNVFSPRLPSSGSKPLPVSIHFATVIFLRKHKAAAIYFPSVSDLTKTVTFFYCFVWPNCSCGIS